MSNKQKRISKYIQKSNDLKRSKSYLKYQKKDLKLYNKRGKLQVRKSEERFQDQQTRAILNEIYKESK